MKKIFRFVAYSLISLFLVFLASVAGARAETVVVKAGRLIDPAAGTAAVNQIILVEGSKIKAVGPNLSIPRDARVVDLSRATVLPGLFDCHTHMVATVPVHGKTLRDWQSDILLYMIGETTTGSFPAPNERREN